MGRLSIFLILCAGWGQAQSTAEIRDILSRLQRLEDSNRALNEEVRSLKEQLASARGGSSQGEQIAVQGAGIEEMAQSKVESSQKLPVRITGMALFNTYVNGAFNANVPNTLIASLSRNDATGGGTFRQSVLGLQFESPRNFMGAKVTGS